MLPRRPRLGLDLPLTRTRKRSDAAPSSYTPVKERVPSLHEDHPYVHTSVFRRGQIEIHVRSPYTKVVKQGQESSRYLPVFSENSKVEGTVVLDVGAATRGRLTISIEGAFVFLSPHMKVGDHSVDVHRTSAHRHVFFLSSVVAPVTAMDNQRSSSSLREAFASSVRPRRERRPSQTDIRLNLKHFPFSFDLPHSTRAGEELPPTFSSVVMGQTGTHSRAYVERAEVAYKIVATWEPMKENDHISLEAPILFEPDTDFQSLDGLELERESWLEKPLDSDRPIPFTCAVALPDPPSFSRSGTIPYFVVFTTTPRSTTLAHEIIADATVAVSLVRQITIDGPPVASSLSLSPTSRTSRSSGEPDLPSPAPPRRLFKRAVKSAPPILMRTPPGPKRLGVPPPPDKPLPRLPGEWLSETRTLQTDVSVGFPKRPRMRVEPHQRHPSLSAHNALPDGLYKGKIQLDKHMLPAFKWTGLSIKYFLDVSVAFGQDAVRGRVPIRLV
ncbi:hypothetical protein SCP_0509350 [Sparassis crispa]|uniref:Uncharacterized protein n=1 Tax=Sparassis crispa TaxID=139825 RepID=A0A401GNS8_9APHY|nr:hypothetical protein SCP_0509350 [Sparassis crispa]GBE83878.1 hypothetical protein SCP_0509350 [Sparassis crispa]